MSDPFLCALPEGATLPKAVFDLHDQPGTFRGRCHIERGKGVLVAFALHVGRFPRSGQDLPVALVTQPKGEGRIWSRDFAGHVTRSNLTYDSHRNCVREQIGGLTIWIRPVLAGDRLTIDVIRLKLWGVPCPKALLPKSSSCEWQDDLGRFRFDISARMPGLGQLIRYHGWLTRDHEAQLQP